MTVSKCEPDEQFYTAVKGQPGVKDMCHQLGTYPESPSDSSTGQHIITVITIDYKVFSKNSFK
jgi:hypothetical protein